MNICEEIHVEISKIDPYMRYSHLTIYLSPEGYDQMRFHSHSCVTNNLDGKLRFEGIRLVVNPHQQELFHVKLGE